MKILSLVQGTPEWHAARAKRFTASEAPVMMGVSTKMKRNELLRLKKTGVDKEVSEFVERLYEKGHKTEALARSILEAKLGEELYPIVAEDDDGRLLASVDGSNMLGDTGFEHKIWNKGTAAMVLNGEVPEEHATQMDQQILVCGFEKVIFVCSDGTEANWAQCEYRTTPERQAALEAGWAQFEKDLAEYVPEPEAENVVGTAPEMLPALRIEVTGAVTASNLAEFREFASKAISGINTNLQTDQDFANAEQAVKWCEEVEKRLDAAKQHALSQTESIDELFRTIDAIKEEARQQRLKLEKLVKGEKDKRKLEVIASGQARLVDHLTELNVAIGQNLMPGFDMSRFSAAIRNLRSIDSIKNAVDTELSKMKIEADAVFKVIIANQKAAENDMDLAPDFASICTKPPEDFKALLVARKMARDEAEEQKRLKEAAQAAAAQLEPPTPPADPQPAPQVAAPRPVAVAAKPTSSVPTPGKEIALGKLNEALGPISISKDGLATLGINPLRKERSAWIYNEADIARASAAIIEHLQGVIVEQRKAA